MTAKVEEIELPLKAAKQQVDDAAEQSRHAAEKAEADRIAAEEKAKRDAEEARIQAERVQMRRDIRKAAADPDTSAIMLVIDSPGGTVAGTDDLAAEVRAASKKKPVYAYVQDLCASAAYWVASQADKIYANSNTETTTMTMTNPPQVVDEEKQYTEGILAQYNPSDAKIAALKDKHTELLKIIADNPAAAKDHEVYNAVTLARREVLKCRVQIEQCREILKRKSLIEGRAIDSVAKRLKALVAEIETPLTAAKDLVDNEKEQARLAAEQAEKDRIAAEEKAKRGAEEARIQAERAAERERNRIEQERLDKERAELEAEKARIAAAQRAEQEKIDAARKQAEAEQRAAQAKIDEANKAIREEQQRLERIKFEEETRVHLAKEAEAEAARKVEVARLLKEKAEREEKQRLEDEAAELARVKAALPDQEKIRDFGSLLRTLSFPGVKSDEATIFLKEIRTALTGVATRCESYAVKPARKREAKVAA